MLAISWEYLTGRSVASDPVERDEPDWPPSPDRVFQAMVAAWAETLADPAGESALTWLEEQGPPDLVEPRIRAAANPKVYVPVNDDEGKRAKEYGEGLVSLLPARRVRKERSFPAVQVDGVASLVWPHLEPPAAISDALGRICGEVTHIGHSRSFVRMWLDPEPRPATLSPAERGLGGRFLRVPCAGRLSSLRRAFADGTAGWRRPASAPWLRYAQIARAPDAPRGSWDDRWIVLRFRRGSAFGAIHADALARAMRGTLLGATGLTASARELISGHEAGGEASKHPHLAILTLPDVGHGHADGHAMGMALLVPRGLSIEDEDGVFDALLDRLDPESGTLSLFAGRAGRAELSLDERTLPPVGLRPATWSTPAERWATVTPIVLDRLPPDTLRRGGVSRPGLEGWMAEQVQLACARQGLPTPEVAVSGVSRWLGAPIASEFPPSARKPDGARRWHVHAELLFPMPVSGPLLLGAGRHRGVGLCRPLGEE